MSDAVAFAAPDSVYLRFDLSLSEKKIADAKNFYWLQKHLKNIPSAYKPAWLNVTGVRYLPNGKVLAVDVESRHSNPDGSTSPYGYSVKPDTVNVLVAFKLVGMTLSGRRTIIKNTPSLAVMTVRESRFSWCKTKSEGPVGGFREEGEPAIKTARREIIEETGSALPAGVDIFRVYDAYLDGGSTEKRSVLGAYFELHGDRPEDRAFVKRLRKAQGGLAEEGEKTHVRLRSFESFLKKFASNENAVANLRLFVEKITERGDPEPQKAFESAQNAWKARDWARHRSSRRRTPETLSFAAPV